MLKWKKGRQDASYELLTLWSRWKCDCHLIKIPAGTEIPEHTDKVTGKKHYRLNIHLGKYEGGKFNCKNVIYELWNRIYLFRPDMEIHSMNKIKSGQCLIISVGWAI